MPSFVALLAQEESLDQDGSQKTPPGFLVMHLPFHDDIRDVPIEFPNVEVNEDQLNAAKAIIKKMKLRQFDTAAFENPALQSHYKLVEALALQKEDVEDLTFDSTIPPYDSMKQRLGKVSQDFSDATMPSEELINDCNAKKQEKEAAKRPWTSAAPGPKKLKIVSEVTPDEMEKMVKSKTVEKLNMDFLKSFLKSLGSTVTGKKKAQLVQEVYDYFSAADFCD